MVGSTGVTVALDQDLLLKEPWVYWALAYRRTTRALELTNWTSIIWPWLVIVFWEATWCSQYTVLQCLSRITSLWNIWTLLLFILYIILYGGVLEKECPVFGIVPFQLFLWNFIKGTIYLGVSTQKILPTLNILLDGIRPIPTISISQMIKLAIINSIASIILSSTSPRPDISNLLLCCF